MRFLLVTEHAHREKEKTNGPEEQEEHKGSNASSNFRNFETKQIDIAVACAKFTNSPTHVISRGGDCSHRRCYWGFDIIFYYLTINDTNHVF